MSTFPGVMSEINYISIDRFTGTNLKSLAFFLSHCHSDHMKGISSDDFRWALEQTDTFLYASAVSCAILEKMHPHLTSRVKPLNCGLNYVEIPEREEVLCVTLIPAGHCPGSVMFLFENDQTVLYTGDIRINASDLRKCKYLYDSTDALKRIDRVYLDTTFFNSGFLEFPSRSESSDEFCRLSHDWLTSHNENIIQIETPATYAYESLFMDLANCCNMPVHVSEAKYQLYKCFPNMDDVVTMQADKTRIHNYCDAYPKYCSAVTSARFGRVLKLRPSALVWKDADYSAGLSKRVKFGATGICYSTHCSHNELIAILEFLQPRAVTPCVVPSKETELEMLRTIGNILGGRSQSGSETGSSAESETVEWWDSKPTEANPIEEQLDERIQRSFEVMDSPERNDCHLD